MIDRQLNYGRAIIARYLQQSAPYQTVLDIGAGTGTDLKAARAVFPNCTAIAIEVYEPYVNQLQQAGFKVIRANIEKDQLPLDDASIEVIIANQILEHTKEVFWIFHEISRVLSVKGHLIIGVPNLAALHNRILLMLGSQPSPLKVHSAHVRGFTKGGLMTFLNECFPCGYVLKEFRGSNFYPFPPFIAQPLARIFPNLAWGIFFLLQKVEPYQKEFLEYPINQKLETNFWLGQETN